MRHFNPNDVTEDKPVTGKQHEGMNYTPYPTCGGAYVALLKIALNQLENKCPAANQIAEKIGSGQGLLQVGMVAGFYLDSNLKGC